MIKLINMPKEVVEFFEAHGCLFGDGNNEDVVMFMPFFFKKQQENNYELLKFSEADKSLQKDMLDYMSKNDEMVAKGEIEE